MPDKPSYIILQAKDGKLEIVGQGWLKKSKRGNMYYSLKIKSEYYNMMRRKEMNKNR